MEDTKRAEQLCSEILAIFPNNIPARNALERLKKIGQGTSSSATPAAQDQLENLIALYQKNLIALYRKDRLREVIALGEVLIEKSPQSIVIYDILGAACARSGRVDRALDCYTKVLQFKPDYAEAHYNLGNILKGLDRRVEAIDCFTKALKIKPDFAEAHYNLGNTLVDHGRHDEAIDCFTKALKIKPNFAEALYNLGDVHKDNGRLEEAIDCFTKALKVKPDFAEAQIALGNALKDLDRHDEAIGCFTKALKINPGSAEAQFNLGNALVDLDRHNQAIDCFTKALRIKPDFAEAYIALGNVHNGLGRRDEVIDCFTKALRINSDIADVHNNLGITFAEVSRFDEAIVCFTEALKINPDFADAHYNFGNALVDLGRHKDAIDRFDKALSINPDYAEARAARLIQQAYICDWEAIDVDAEAIKALGISNTAIAPFAPLPLEDDPARHRVRSEQYTLKKTAQKDLRTIIRPDVKPDRLRIGYFSADFRNHALMYLMAKFFEVHDRDRFEVHAFSFGPNSNDTMATRLKNAVEVFHDIRSLSDDQAAALSRSKTIDIAIDLTCHTANNRLGIFSRRAAPIQMNYLGYPGTSGASFIDYIIADKFVIPEKNRQFYSEKAIYLPNSFLVNDNSREIFNGPISRLDMGLPSDGFIFCCFNNTYKITQHEFNIWMRLLQKVEGSVLWLREANEWAAANLKKEAQRRHIDPNRLIFYHKLPMPEHLARHRLADLFLGSGLIDQARI